MTLLVFGDLHGNLPALEALLAAAKKTRAEEVLCLGNAIGEGPHADEVVDLLRKRHVTCLMGPHEASIAGRAPARDATDRNLAALSRTNLRFLGGLTDARRLALGGRRALLAWTPWAGTWEPVPRDAAPGDAARWLEGARADVALLGGAPHPVVRELPAGGTLAFPGPAGLNPEGPEAPHLVVHPEQGTLEVRHVAYDADPLIRDMLKSGRSLDAVPRAIRHGVL